MTKALFTFLRSEIMPAFTCDNSIVDRVTFLVVVRSHQSQLSTSSNFMKQSTSSLQTDPLFGSLRYFGVNDISILRWKIESSDYSSIMRRTSDTTVLISFCFTYWEQLCYFL